MKLEKRYSEHPDDAKLYDTQKVRERQADGGILAYIGKQPK